MASRAGILELVLELARRVERVDVDHGVAGAQDAAIMATGYCSTFGIIMRDARALLQPFDCR